MHFRSSLISISVSVESNLLSDLSSTVLLFSLGIGAITFPKISVISGISKSKLDSSASVRLLAAIQQKKINLDSSDWNINSQLVAAKTAIDGYGDTDTLLAGDVHVHGSYFDDFVQGSEFGQFFNLRAGNDTAYGFDGDDNFNGGSGDDFIDGGAGWDNLDYHDDGFDGSGLTATQGIVANISSADFDYGTGIALANRTEDSFGDLDSVFNIESVDGTERDDIIIGSAGHNWLRGNEGNDQLYGNGEGDSLVGGAGDDYLDGGAGDWDTAWYNQSEELNGINVNLAAGTASDDGFGNTDTLVSIENVEGSAHDDIIVGDSNHNNLVGNEGNDVMYGADGDDNFSDRDGNDQTFGENGHDWFHASSGDDLLDGGAGNDTADYRAHTGTTSGITLDMTAIVDAGGYNNVVVTADGFGNTDYLRSIERIHATDSDDSITGDANNNEFFGAGGNDILNGGDGDDFLSGEDDFDTLNGGAGNDHLDGGENDDSLTGGSEGDTFSFSRFTNQGDLTSFGEDVITDFSISEDHLSLYHVPEFTSLEALQSFATQDGSDVLISFVTNDFGIDETNSIRLQNMLLSDLPNMNISFSPIMGTDGDDVIDGGAFGENIVGGDGNDVLNGNGGNDDLFGENGNDILNGGSGFDSLKGGPGNDTLDGGADQDNAVYRWSGETNGVVVDLSNGTASNDGFGDSDTLLNIENIEGSEFDDNITGDAGDNYLDGREGNDIIFGGDGHDGLAGGQGHDQLFGEAGSDWFTGHQGDDLIDGGAGEDQVNYDSWSGTTSGVSVDLSVITPLGGGYSNVVVVTNDGFTDTDYLRNIENVSGTDFSDTLTGDALNNQLRGNGGDDVLTGNQGDDHLQGDDGDDNLNGGPGNDFLFGGPGVDTIDGGADWDNLAFDNWTGVVNGVNVNLALNTVSDDGFGSTDSVFNIERVQGSDFDDIIAGDSFDNHLLGNGGNDTLSGGGGNDSLEGGLGDDLFVLSDGGNIHISDFVAGAGTEDVIDLQDVSSLSDFAGVLAVAVDDGGGNVNIDLGGNNLHLVGVNVASLHVDDFIF